MSEKGKEDGIGIRGGLEPRPVDVRADFPDAEPLAIGRDVDFSGQVIDAVLGSVKDFDGEGELDLACEMGGRKHAQPRENESLDSHVLKIESLLHRGAHLVGIHQHKPFQTFIQRNRWRLHRPDN